MFRRVLSLILCLCVLMTSMPTWSIAAALAEEEEVIVEVVSEEVEEEEEEPTPKPTKEPTPEPTKEPTPEPTEEPTPEPTKEPTPEPTKEPTPEPTKEPTPEPTEEPTPEVTEEPEVEATEEPVVEATEEPVVEATEEPVVEATEEPVVEATEEPVVEATEEPVVEATEEPVVEATEEPVAEEEPRFVDGYAYVKAGEDVYSDDELTEVLGAFAEKTVVYVSDREETADEDQDVLTLRFACDDELVKGYIAAKDVKPLDEDETADYEDEAADGVHYEDDVYLLSVEFNYEDEQTESPEVTEEPVVEATEEPVVEATEEPVVEATEEPVVEATEEPVVEATEEPVVEATEEPVVEATEEPVVEPTEEPVVEATEEPVVEATEEPVVEATEEPVVEETEEPADEATPSEPAAEVVEGEGDLTDYNDETCAHSQTTPAYIWNVVGEVTADAKNHTGTFTRVTIEYCKTCDDEVSRTEAEELTGSFPHEFMGKDGDSTTQVCHICDYELVCTHNPEIRETQSWNPNEAIDNGDGTHTVPYTTAKSAYCGACGFNTYYEVIGEPVVTTEKHKAGSDGTCFVCGAEILCEHPESKVKFYEEVYSNIAYTNITDTTHDFTCDIVSQYHCSECGAWYGVTVIQEDAVFAGEAHTFYGGKCSWCGTQAYWMAAAQIDPASVKQPADKQVAFTVSGKASTYNVYEELGETDKLVKTVTAAADGSASVLLTSVAVGEHTYYVKPVGVNADKTKTEGEASNAVTWRVDNLGWKKAPVIKTAKQLTDREGAVTLTWTHAVRAEYYVILDGEEKIAATTELTVTLENQADGKHSYYVQPMGHDYNGTEIEGTKSAVKALTVAELWNKKPTLSAAKQDTTGVGEGLVTLTIKRAAGALTGAYAVFEKGIENPIAIITSDEATVTHTLEGVEAGSHVYSVAPAKLTGYDENGNALYETGLVSAAKTVKVVDLWNKKGTISVAKQVADEEGHVQLTVKSGSALTQAWVVYDKFNKMTVLLDVVVSDEPTVVIDLYNLAAGSHSVTVKPAVVDYDENGEVVIVEEGLVSAAKAVKVVEYWLTAPTISSAAQVDAYPSDEDESVVVGVVELKWTAGSDLTQAYAVYDTFSKKKTLVDVVVGDTAAVVEVKGAGSHSLTVVPVVRIDENLDYSVENEANLKQGKTSKAKAVKIVGATWQDAPVLKGAQYTANAEGEVLLTWSQIVEADGFGVYEVVTSGKTKTYVPVNGEEDTPTVEGGVTEYVVEGVEAGKHTYVVLPYNYDDNTGWTSEGAKYSNTVAVTVAELWSQKPTISEAVQEIDEDNIVSLEWKPANELSNTFVIYDGGTKDANLIVDEFGNPQVFYGDEATFEGVKAGTHTYYVKPVKMDINGEFIMDYGTISAAKKVVVKALWNAKPVIKSAVQLTEAERTVKLTFTTSAKAPGTFILEKKVGSAYEQVLGAYDFLELLDAAEYGDTDILSVDGNTYTVILNNEFFENNSILDFDAVGKGSNIYRVVPAVLDEYGDVETGLASATKTVSVKDLWALKPTGLTAVQIKSEDELAQIKESLAPKLGDDASYLDYIDFYDHLVMLTWNAGSNPNMTEYYDVMVGTESVYESENDVPVYAYFVPQGQSGQNVMFIGHREAGAKSYKVVPMSDYYEGSGIASAVKKLTVTDIWKAAPTITNVRQAADDVVEITWEAPNYLPDEFVIIDTVGKTKTEVDYELNMPRAISYEYTAVIRDVEPGTHKYTVQPAIYDEEGERQLGTASAAKSLTLVDVKWSAAPWITSISQNAVNKAYIYWEHVTDAESYIVYELTDTGLVEIGTSTNKYFEVEVSESGTYTYAVRPAKTDEYGNLVTGAMSETESAELYASADAKVEGFTAVQNGFTAELEWAWDDFSAEYTVEMISESGDVIESEKTDDVAYQFSVDAAGTYGFRVRPIFGNLSDDQNAAVPYSKTIWLEFGEKVTITEAKYDLAKNGVVLKWTTSTAKNVSGYRVYRYDDWEEEFVILASGSFANKTYTDTSVEIGETYQYAVAAYRTTGEDVLSDAVTVDVEMPSLSAPQNFAGKHYGEMVKLTWDGVPEESEYDVYYEIWTVSDDYDIEQIAATGVGVHEYNVEADPVNPVTYIVVACAEVGDRFIAGDWSEEITVSPNPVSVVSAAFNTETGAIEVQWTEAANAKQYVLQRSVNGGEWTDDMIAGDFFWMDSEVELGNTYAYRVITTFETGASCSEAASVQLKRLGKVTGLENWFFNGFVDFMWDDMVTVSGYEIQRSEDGVNYDTIATITEQEYLDTLEKKGFTVYTDELDESKTYGYTYSYRVRGLMGDKTGAWSSVSTVKIGQRPVVTDAYYSYKEGGVVIEWEPYAGANGFNIMRDGHSIIDDLIPADATRYVDTGAVIGETYSYDLNVLVDGGEISCDPAIKITPQALPKVGVSRTWYINEQTKIDLILPENASEEFVYVVKENGAIIESKIDGETVTVKAPDLKDHTYTVHVGVVMNDGNILTGEGTEVTIDRGELWKLKNITDDADGVHLYWDVLADSMPTKLFVMSYDVTDADKHVNRGGTEAAAESGTYVDAEAAFTGKKLDYWLEAEYGDDVNGGLLSSEGMSDCEELLPYQVRKLEKVAGLKTSYAGKMVDLIWNAQEEVPAYEIERSDDNGASYTAVATVSAEEYEANKEATEGLSAYTDTVPNFDAKYLYRIRAVAGEQAGAYSDAAVAAIGAVPEVKSAEHSYKQGGIVVSWDAYSVPSGYVLDSYAIYRMAEGESFHNLYEVVDADKTSFVDTAVETGKTYSYKLAVGMKNSADDQMITGQIQSANAVTAAPQALPTVGVDHTFYFNEQTEIYLTLPENASEEFTYAVKENGELIDAELVEDDGELKLVFDTTLNYEQIEFEDHTYTVHVAVETVNGDVMTGDGTEVTVSRGKLWTLSNIYDDEDGVHLGWYPYEDSMPEHLFVMSVDVTDPEKHSYRDLDPADAASGTYVDNVGDIALSGKTFDYWLEAVYEDGVLSSEGVNRGIQGMFPYTVTKSLFSYYELSDGTIAIWAYRGKNTENVVFPSDIDGKTVTKIGDYGDDINSYNGALTGTITLPDTLKELGGCAFMDHELSGKLVLPKSLDVVGSVGKVFKGNNITEAEIYCKGLTADEIALLGLEGVTKIYGYLGTGAEEYAEANGIEFEGIGLTDSGEKFVWAEDGETAVFVGFETEPTGAVTIPATVDGIKVTEIGANTFKGNTAITSVTVPDGVTVIGESAFEGCTSLASADLPDSVEIIGVRAFANCTALSSMQ